MPSARSQGEPLSGRFGIVAGETLEYTLMAKNEQQFLISSDSGYGFVCQFEDMLTRQKAGKALVRLPSGAKLLEPQRTSSMESDDCLVITNEGRMLVFPLKDLPILSKGKGNKIINIPSARAANREEIVSQIIVVPESANVVLHAGKRKLTLTTKDIEHYRGERGRRGSKLPRGLQRVDRVEVEMKGTTADISNDDSTLGDVLEE